ncbi:P-loop containing nucleoside triphosphate hydrolase protein, partial [Suillus lakei]
MKLKTRRSKKPQNGPNAKEPSSETKGSQDDSDHVIQLLGAAVTAINITRDIVPIDLAKGILGTIANILIIAQSVIKNQSDFQAIVDKCETIRDILERATKDAADDDLRGYLGHALSQLNKSVNRINSEVASKKEQGFWHRLLSVTSDRDRIAGWEKDLDRVIPLFSAEMLVGLTIGMNTRTSGLQGDVNVKVERYHPPVPPPRPSMFYGREDLVAELTNLVINDEHIALIGLGGMGKSSLAKAIINEPLVMEKFADRRFFVTYDGLDPSTITFETFTTRFAEALGIELAGADPVRQISTLLHSASALVVLDNAETFEEASGSSALGEIPPAIAEIADIPGVILILTSRSRRNAPNVRWITKDIPPLDLNSAQAAFFQIYHHANRSDAGEDIRDLLKELEFHPLSINLLSNAAQQNSWPPATLLKRWNNRHSKVLDPGKGKLQSLSDAMQLSLSSPSMQDLGEDGCRVLAIIAFLPQGLNDALASDLLPSLPQVEIICDVLCRQSLVYRQDSFIKLLAPIRHYVRDLQAPDSACLREIRAFYYRIVECCFEEHDYYADIITSDHLNIEHVVAFN